MTYKFFFQNTSVPNGKNTFDGNLFDILLHYIVKCVLRSMVFEDGQPKVGKICEWNMLEVELIVN